MIKLTNGDIIRFLPNLLKDDTFGDIIIDVNWMFLQDKHARNNLMITDDPKIKIFPKLVKFNQEKGERIFNINKKYYINIEINGKQEIMPFGFTLYNKILSEPDFLLKYFKFLEKPIEPHRFMSYDDSYFRDYHNKAFDKNYLSQKTEYLEDIENKSRWTNPTHYERFKTILSSMNIDLETIIKEITLENREKKLNRVLGTDTENLIKDFAKSFGYSVKLKKIKDDRENERTCI